MTEDARADASSWPAWLRAAWCRRRGDPNSVWPSDFPDSDGTDELMLQSRSLLGTRRVAHGDWLVHNVGEPGDIMTISDQTMREKFPEVINGA